MLNAGGRTLTEEPNGPFSMQGRTLNAGTYAQCSDVLPMEGRTPNGGPYAQCRAVRSMQGRTLNAGPYAQCRAVRSMQGRTVNAGPYGQCKAVRSMQGRTVNASTRAWCECIAHVLQGITELHPELTITSVDGIRAFDMISRESMLRWLLEVEGGGAALPFIRYYGSPSEYV